MFRLSAAYSRSKEKTLNKRVRFFAFLAGRGFRAALTITCKLTAVRIIEAKFIAKERKCRLEEILLLVLGAAVIALIIKIIVMKSSAREIAEKLSDKLSADTNTLIDISSADRDMKRLADELNKQLRLLREERQHYMRGDSDLKKAVTNISHDLRTPLTAISGYLDMLENEEKSENAARYLNVIRERAEALKTLSEELFSYSLITAASDNGITPEYEELSLNAAVEDSVLAFYAVLTERGITPEINLPENRVVCRLDKKLLSRILSNIISNAVKYSDGDLEITLTDSGGLIFRNSAASLDEIAVKRLFDRFYTVENAGGSTGLGLSIAKTLTELMGGEISARYIDGKLAIEVNFMQERS